MDAALVESGPEIHAVLVEPMIRLSRWATRRNRGAGDIQLRAAAWGMLGAFEELLALPVTELGIEVYARPAEQPLDPGDIARPQEIDRVSAFLESVRSIRVYMCGPSSDSLARALRVREGGLATEFEEKRAAAAARLLDWERWLVGLGAGGDEDAHLGRDLVPLPPADLSAAAHSVAFEL